MKELMIREEIVVDREVLRIILKHHYRRYQKQLSIFRRIEVGSIVEVLFGKRS